MSLFQNKTLMITGGTGSFGNAVLNRFLHTLPKDVRGVFIRRYWHMQSIAQIATVCSMSESRVKSQLMRTRKKLKTYLMEEGFSV